MDRETRLAPTVIARPQEMWAATVVRYPKPYRRRLALLARSNPAVADLLTSFPAAAFTLAAEQGPLANRARALELIKAGEALDAVGEVLALPRWMRKLPPETFARRFRPIDTGPAFNRAIGNLIPTGHDARRMWLPWVLEAHARGGESFALWLAKRADWELMRRRIGLKADERMLLTPALLFAWHSTQGRDTPAGRLIRRGWSSGATARHMFAASRHWLTRVYTALCTTPPASAGAQSWRKSGRAGGYMFHPRRTADELRAEGRQSDNCVGGYVDDVAVGRCLIFGVRRRGKPAGTVEIVVRPDAPGKPVVAQLESPGNQDPTPELQAAVARWLSRMGPCPLAPAAQDGTVGPVSAESWAEVWAPYRAAGGGGAELERRARPTAMRELCAAAQRVFDAHG